MNTKELFNKYSDTGYDAGERLIDEDNFIDAMSEALCDGHVQPVVIAAKEQFIDIKKLFTCASPIFVFLIIGLVWGKLHIPLMAIGLIVSLIMNFVWRDEECSERYADEQKLKFCPFCGGRPKLQTNLRNNRVICIKCGAYGGHAYYSEEEAVQKWNKRASGL